MKTKPANDEFPRVADPANALPAGDCAFVADWTDFMVLNFSLSPERLRPHVPYPLDLYEGRAWVSLVWFNLRRLRPAITGALGRWLFRPVSDHPFLNVRTYVQPQTGPGICFLAEWIPNRLSTAIGPITYGLPYRRGRFATEIRPSAGTSSLRIDAPGHAAPFVMTAPQRCSGAAECPAGSVDAFLLERYQAYTMWRGRGRRFRVAHARWQAARIDWVRYELGFLRDVFPWFGAAEFQLAHRCAPATDVGMGFPHAAQLEPFADVPAPAERVADTPLGLPAHA